MTSTNPCTPCLTIRFLNSSSLIQGGRLKARPSRQLRGRSRPSGGGGGRSPCSETGGRGSTEEKRFVSPQGGRSRISGGGRFVSPGGLSRRGKTMVRLVEGISVRTFVPRSTRLTKVTLR